MFHGSSCQRTIVAEDWNAADARAMQARVPVGEAEHFVPGCQQDVGNDCSVATGTNDDEGLAQSSINSSGAKSRGARWPSTSQ